MASVSATPGPKSAPIVEGSGVTPSPPTPEKLQTSFDYGIWYLLSLWPALHTACQNGWGGPESMDKKDWFAGAISEIFAERPSTRQDDLEEILIQVMFDEFDSNLEDDSEIELAGNILALRKRLFEEQDLSALRELEIRWRNRGQMKMNVQVVGNGNNGEDDDDDDDGTGFDDQVDQDGDVEMGDADLYVPHLVPASKQEKPKPKVDEDGFTKVTSKSKKKKWF